MVVAAVRTLDTPEVEPQRGDADRRQRVEETVDHAGVHVATVERMRMAKDRCRQRGLDGCGTPFRTEAETVGCGESESLRCIVVVGGHGGARYCWLVPDDKAASKAKRKAKGKLPIKMMSDRILVELEGAEGDRRSSGGILIPATAQVGKRLTWGLVVATGPSVRSMELDDRVLFNPEDRYEVEVGGSDYIILRERDIHAVAAKRLDDSPTGLYL